MLGSSVAVSRDAGAGRPNYLATQLPSYLISSARRSICRSNSRLRSRPSFWCSPSAACIQLPAVFRRLCSLAECTWSCQLVAIRWTDLVSGHFQQQPLDGIRCDIRRVRRTTQLGGPDRARVARVLPRGVEGIAPLGVLALKVREDLLAVGALNPVACGPMNNQSTPPLGVFAGAQM